MHLYLDQRERHGDCTLVIHTSDEWENARQNPIWLRENNMYNSSVSSLSIIIITQTVRQCFGIQFHVRLYVLTLDDIEMEHADL